MTVYRVGPEGATVLAADGRVIQRLRPGHVVVPGIVQSGERPPLPDGPPPTDAAPVPRRRRPRAAYATKPIRPAEVRDDG